MSSTDDVADMALPWERLLEKAMGYAGYMIEFQESWAPAGSTASVDLTAGTIRFTNERGTASAPVQVIGTVDTSDSSWMWGWDHPSVPAPQAVHAARVREYGLRHDVPDLTTRHIPVSAEEPLQFTAIAALLSRAQGLTSLSAGTADIYLTYGEVTLSPDGDPPDGGRGGAVVVSPSADALPLQPVPGMPAPAATEPRGIPTHGPWLDGPEPATSAEAVVAFVQAYLRQMHPLYHREYTEDGDPLEVQDEGVVLQAQTELNARTWRRTDTFYSGGVQGNDREYDLAVTADWRVHRVAPRLWQVTWVQEGRLRWVRGVLVMVFDDGPRLVDHLEADLL